MLCMILSLFSCSAQDPTIGSLKIGNLGSKTMKLPRSSMEPLSLNFSIELSENSQIPSDPAIVNLLVYKRDLLWKTFTTEAFQWQSGHFSQIFLTEGEFYLSLNATLLKSCIVSRFTVEEPRANLSMKQLAKNSYLMVYNKYCFTLTDQFFNQWNQSVKKLNCSTDGAYFNDFGNEMCVNQIFINSGHQNMYVECGESNFRFPVYVNQLKMEFDNFQPPKNSSHSFNVSVYLKCNNTIYTEIDANFQVSIGITEKKIENETACSGLKLFGAINTSFSSGKAIFKNINILSNGRFVINAVSFGLLTLSSGSFVVHNFIKSISFKYPNDSMHFPYFSMFLDVIGDDDELFTREFKTIQKFNDIHCINYTKNCSNSTCYNCVTLRLANQNLSLTVIDKLYPIYQLNKNYNHTVLPNKNASVKIEYINNHNYEMYPFPAMSYDSFFLIFYIKDGNDYFMDIPCYKDNNYIEKICISDACSNNKSVEIIETFCERNKSFYGDQGWKTYGVVSRTNYFTINSIGEYIFSIPFINDLKAETEFLSITSFISGVECYNLTRIFPNQESRFLLNLTGPDGFPYIKCNYIHINYIGIQNNLPLWVCNGFLEFTVNFTSKGSYILEINSTHMKGSRNFTFQVEKSLENEIEILDFNKNLNTSENFNITFKINSTNGSTLDCLLYKLNLTILFINNENNEKFIIQKIATCKNKTYKVSNISILNLGNYSVEIYSDAFKTKKLNYKIIVKEKLNDIRLNPLPIIYQNHPFEISFRLFSSPSILYQGDLT